MRDLVDEDEPGSDSVLGALVFFAVIGAVALCLLLAAAVALAGLWVFGLL